MLRFQTLQSLISGSVKILNRVQDSTGALVEVSFVSDSSNIEQVLRSKGYELTSFQDGVKTYRIKDSRQRVF